EARVEVSGSSFGPAAGPGLLCFSGRASPRGRGRVRGLWLSSQYRRLCDLSPEGKPGAARLDFVSATPVLGVLGAVVVGAVLAVARNSAPARIYACGWGNPQLRCVRSRELDFPLL